MDGVEPAYGPKQTLDETLFWCLNHFANLDKANAAIHTSKVRFSPITFRLAEHLNVAHAQVDVTVVDPLLLEVLEDLEQYAEDRGRV